MKFLIYLTFNKLNKFENDHIFQNNGFINVDKKYQGTFLSKKNEVIKRYHGDDFLNLPCCQYKVR